jgi:hypothetical protein
MNTALEPASKLSEQRIDLTPPAEKGYIDTASIPLVHQQSDVLPLLKGIRKPKGCGQHIRHPRLQAAPWNEARQYPLGAVLLHGRDEVEDGGFHCDCRSVKNSLKQPHAK